MTRKEAYDILELPPGSGLQEIKKRYRQLITQVHPDANVFSPEHSTNYTQKINQAYSVLKNEFALGSETISHGKKKNSQKENSHVSWNAPVNPNAYTEREILHYAEGQDGAVLGSFCIARGKYLWSTDEDFPLFLLSLYRCGKRLLDLEDQADTCSGGKKSPAHRQRIQTELTYLLAQQFIDGTVLLEELAKEETPGQDGRRIFYISSTLEPVDKGVSWKADETLYPSGIRKHKLYLKNQLGQELGYVSFPDDRLYYVVIPLFEQKAVQVRIQTAKRQPGRALHLWVKLSGQTTCMPENLNLQIEQLLAQYRQ